MTLLGEEAGTRSISGDWRGEKLPCGSQSKELDTFHTLKEDLCGQRAAWNIKGGGSSMQS